MDVSARDFTTPVELRSIQSADRTLLRFIPVLALLSAGVLVLALLILGLLLPKLPGVYYPVSIALALAVPLLMYVQKRRQLDAEYRVHKTLRLSHHGLRRADATTVVEIPWAGITGLQEEPVSFAAKSRGVVVFPITGVANAAKKTAHSVTAVGIVGSGAVTAQPHAPQHALRLHDERNGSRLQHGEAHPTSRALIFPSEFEPDWAGGVIGAWLRHHRPDIEFDR